MKRAALFCAFLLVAFPAFAAGAIHARPALWHVRGKGGEAYLLGSIHVLPKTAQWRTPAIAKAMKRADVFVFELPSDAATMDRMRDMIVAHGYLPPGESLRAKLDAAAQADFDAALAAAGLKPAEVDRDRPWLASLQIMFAEIAQGGYDTDSGVDVLVQKQAGAREKRYFETVEQQFALLAPQDDALELSEFQSDLKDLRDGDRQLDDMVGAWSRGDVAAVGDLMNSALDGFPEAKKALLDDRNQAWETQIEAMLKEKHVFFITVGAGHLAGPGGVPALLRKAGYKVDGP